MNEICLPSYIGNAVLMNFLKVQLDIMSNQIMVGACCVWNGKKLCMIHFPTHISMPSLNPVSCLNGPPPLMQQRRDRTEMKYLCSTFLHPYMIGNLWIVMVTLVRESGKRLVLRWLEWIGIYWGFTWVCRIGSCPSQAEFILYRINKWCYFLRS